MKTLRQLNYFSSKQSHKNDKNRQDFYKRILPVFNQGIRKLVVSRKLASRRILPKYFLMTYSLKTFDFFLKPKNYFFLCLFFLRRFFLLCVEILCPFFFFPQGMMLRVLKCLKYDLCFDVRCSIFVARFLT